MLSVSLQPWASIEERNSRRLGYVEQSEFLSVIEDDEQGPCCIITFKNGERLITFDSLQYLAAGGPLEPTSNKSEQTDSVIDAVVNPQPSDRLHRAGLLRAKPKDDGRKEAADALSKLTGHAVSAGDDGLVMSLPEIILDVFSAPREWMGHRVSVVKLHA